MVEGLGLIYKKVFKKITKQIECPFYRLSIFPKHMFHLIHCSDNDHLGTNESATLVVDVS